MLQVLFTLDYEIHGNGEGSPYDLIVEPTARMLDLFDEYGSKLTIMADVAEIIRFRDYLQQYGRDDYHYEAIVSQLRDAVRRGHDVQLHLHCSYFNARFDEGRWLQDWSEYNFATLPYERMVEVIRVGKQFLEQLLQPEFPQYRCHVFRAANWAVQPSQNVVRALLQNGINIDTSVFKYGKRDGLVSFDYTHANSHIAPWRTTASEICSRDDSGALVEMPIYCENRFLPAFLSRSRFYRVRMTSSHRIKRPMGDDQARQYDAPKRPRSWANFLFGRHAWKADFNQCTSNQLKSAVQRALRRAKDTKQKLPFIMIGHSKQFNRYNERELRPFLDYLRTNDDLAFAIFSEVPLPPLAHA